MKIELNDELISLHRYILEWFTTTGSAPTHNDVRTRFALKDEAAAEKLIAKLEASRAIHRAPGDNAITHAYPFSNESTQHRVKLASGTEVYSMCAVDALGIPLMVLQDAAIESTCAHCGGATNVVVQHGEMTRHSPDALLVGYKSLDCCTTPATEQCPNINFFCSQKHLDTWNAEHSDNAVQQLSLAQAFERGRHNFEALLYGK